MSGRPAQPTFPRHRGNTASVRPRRVMAHASSNEALREPCAHPPAHIAALENDVYPASAHSRSGARPGCEVSRAAACKGGASNGHLPDGRTTLQPEISALSSNSDLSLSSAHWPHPPPLPSRRQPDSVFACASTVTVIVTITPTVLLHISSGLVAHGWHALLDKRVNI